MSYQNKNATAGDLKKANKVIKKAKEGNYINKFTKIRNFQDLKILVVTDGSYLKLEEKTKSVMGRFVFLSDKHEMKVNPLCWKAKSIPTVCKSPKASETRAADKAMEEGIFVSRTISEIYTGDRGESQIPVTVLTDSKALLDSVNSTKQIDDKLLRPVIKWMKQSLESWQVNELRWCDTNVCLADILTKTGVKLTEMVMKILQDNDTIDLRFSKKVSE